jgi:short-chain fatty acids transporter
MAAILIALSVAIAYFSCPAAENARTAADAGIVYEPFEVARGTPATPAERFDNSPVLSLLVALLLLAYLVLEFSAKGGMAALDLNTFTLAFLALGLLLHLRPRSFLAAVSRSVPATSGVLIQFPFYAGILGMISKTAISERLAEWFVSLTTPGSFPVVVAIYSGVLGMFVPSGGGKWVIEAPYVMQAANLWHVHLGWTVQIYNAAEALPNLINPFWMLPLMGILNVKAKDLAGYSVLQLLFHVPVVLFLAWLFAGTLTYLPPAS